MGDRTGIEWTDATVNFWWGCTKVSPACDNCYAEAWDKRTGGSHWGLNAPRKKIKSAVALIRRLDNDHDLWSRDLAFYGLRPRSRRVFVQSMSDLFDLEAPVEWFDEAWHEILRADRLSVQIVTKRVSIVERCLAEIGHTRWPQHAGLIITVCNQREADRDIPRLLALKSRFDIPWVGLSVEPMLGPIDLTQWLWGRAEPCAQCPRDADCECGMEPRISIDGEAAISWCICGGESGAHVRDNNFEANARDLLKQCRAAGVPFFGKQNVGKRPLPADLAVREFPEAR